MQENLDTTIFRRQVHWPGVGWPDLRPLGPLADGQGDQGVLARHPQGRQDAQHCRRASGEEAQVLEVHRKEAQVLICVHSSNKDGCFYQAIKNMFVINGLFPNNASDHK